MSRIVKEMEMKLEKGKKYDSEKLIDELFAGWTDGDGTGTAGYNASDYFDPQGYYLGPDGHGIEPMFHD